MEGGAKDEKNKEVEMKKGKIEENNQKKPKLKQKEENENKTNKDKPKEEYMKEKAENSEFKAKPTHGKSTKPEGKNDETQINFTENIKVKLEVQQNNLKEKIKTPVTPEQLEEQQVKDKTESENSNKPER